MKRKAIMIFIIILIFTSLTGCWSRRELTELAITSAIGIDKAEDKYVLSIQVINPGEIAAGDGGGYDLPVSTYQAMGDTLFEALRKMTTKLPRKAYMSHVRIIVFGEELAKEGIAKALDILSRDHEFRTDFYIVVAKGTKAEKILNVLTPLEKIPANKMFHSLETSEASWAATGTVALDELITDLISEGKEAVLTGIQIRGDPEKGEGKENVEKINSPAILQYSGMAAFKKEKLVGWLNEQESKGYNNIQGNVSNTLVNVPCPKGGILGIEVARMEETIKGKVEQGKPSIDVHIWLEANVADVECKIDLNKTRNIYELETRVEQVIKSNTEAVVKKAQKELKSDILGFGEVIHRSDPKAWKELKNNWGEEFIDLEVNVKVDTKIRRLGTVKESFLEELKE